MDTAVLVKSGRILVSKLDEIGVKPRAAVWVKDEQTDTWRFWILPSNAGMDPHEFYRKVAEIVSANRAELGNLDAADVEFVSERQQPVLRALQVVARVEGQSDVSIQRSVLNGIYVGHVIVLRLAL